MNNQEQSNSKLNKTVDTVVKVKKTVNNFKKYKFMIIFGGITFLVVMLFMFLVMAMDVMGILDDEDSNNSGSSSSSSYSDLMANVNGANNEDLWWPIGSSEVTSTYELDGATLEFRSGDPVDTYISAGYYGYEGHGATDITEGGDIYIIAMADGTVTEITNRNNGYNSWSGSTEACTMEGCVGITITYNNGFESTYLHLENNSIPEYIQEGDKVYQGQVVGKMGNTGCSTGQHLHLALFLNGERVDPENYVSEENPRPMSSGTTSSSEDILDNSISSGGTSDSTTTPGTGEVITGTDNQQTICMTLKNYGYPDTGVAALLVNMHHESGFNPSAVNELGCIGLVQWCFTRQASVKSTYGDNWNLINNQLEYVQKELTSNYYSDAYNSLMGNGSTSDKTYDFCMMFEIPGEDSCVTRKNSSLNSEFETYVNNGCK